MVSRRELKSNYLLVGKGTDDEFSTIADVENKHDEILDLNTLTFYLAQHRRIIKHLN